MKSREELLSHLEKNIKVLTNSAIRNAFEKVDRADFVPEELKDEAYEDYPLPIGYGQTISQPTTVAFMLEKLGVKDGNNVLDIGCGSGWTAALLSELVGESGTVLGVERIKGLVKFGNKNIKKYNYKNTKIIQATENELGDKKNSPYDRVLVSATSDEAPKGLLEQLKADGVMVLPIGESIVVVKKTNGGKVEKKEFPGFVFVPLVV